jgi:hypothetical protein
LHGIRPEYDFYAGSFNEPLIYWQNQLTADPLATPWGLRPTVRIFDDGEHLSVQAEHPDGIASVALYLDGVRVAEADGDALTHEAAPTEHVLAVAIAANAPVTRAGWPTPDQHPQPDVQGWTTTVEPGTPPDIPDADRESASGCACRAARPSRLSFAAMALAPLALWLLAARRRRR